MKYDDFLISSPAANDDAGKVYLIMGRELGWKSQMSVLEANASYLGENINDHAGRTATKAGDVNGDGYDDFLIGILTTNKAYLFFGKNGRWVKNIPISEAANITFIGENSQDQAGYMVSGGVNFNCDGFDDLVIGAPHYCLSDSVLDENAGKVYVVYGRNNTNWLSTEFDLSNADLALVGELGGQNFGQILTGMQSMTIDFYDELLVGTRQEDTVYLFFGPLTGTIPPPSDPMIPGYTPIILVICLISVITIQTFTQIHKKKQ